MHPAPRFAPALAFLALLLPAGAASAADPVAILQVPSLQPIQEVVIPAVAAALGVTKRKIPPQRVHQQSFVLSHAGRVTGVNPKDCTSVRFSITLARQKVTVGTTYPFAPKVSYEASPLDFPVDAQTFRLSVAGTSAVRLSVDVKSPSAELQSGIKLTTEEESVGQCKTKLWDIDPLKDLANETQSENFELKGLRGSMTARVSAPKGRLTLDEVDELEARLGQVSTRVCKDPDALVKWVNDTFDQRLRSCTDEVTGAVNDALAGKFGAEVGAKALVQSVVGESLEIFDLGTPQQIDPSGAMTPLATSVSLVGLAPKSGGLLARWSIGVKATRSAAGVKLPAFESVARPGLDQPISARPPAGDIVLSLPLELMDRLLYESLRAGLFAGSLTVPAAAAGAACPVSGNAGIGRGFPLTVELSKAPVAVRGAKPEQLVFEAPVRLSALDPARDGLDIQARLRMPFRLQAKNDGELRLRPDGVELVSGKGTLRVCGAELPLSARDTDQLAQVVSARVQSQLGDGYMLRAAVPLPGGVKLSLGSLDVGSAYLTAAFTIRKP